MSGSLMIKSNNNNTDESLTRLLDCVKQCQKKYGGKTELATELDACVAQLCSAIEVIFLHGLRIKPLQESESSAMKQMSEIVTNKLLHTKNNVSFWPFVVNHLTKQERERFNILKHIWTDAGKGKAWIRAALNEKSLERYYHIVLSDDSILKTYYEDWAILRDDEKNSMLPNMAGGLNSILFAISIDKSELNNNKVQSVVRDCEPIINAPIASGKATKENITVRKKKRKVAKQIISFEEDEMSQSGNLSSSVPSSASSGETKYYISSIEHQKMTSTADNETHMEITPIIQIETYESHKSNTNDVHLYKTDVINHLEGTESISNTSQELSDPEHKHFDTTSTSSLNSLSTSRGVANLSLGQTQEHLTPLFQPNIGELTPVSVERKLIGEDTNDDTVESSADISAMLAVVENQNKELVDKLHETITMLRQENKCLKDHLQKYIGAVQMLKRNSDDPCELPECLQDLQLQSAHDCSTSDYGNTSPSPSMQSGTFGQQQYQRELETAALYESKLVQIADMHAELIDFNAMLQQTIHVKNGQLEQVRRELTALRCGRVEEEVQSGGRVQVWVPSAFLTGTGSNTHHVYQIFLRIGSEEWNIYRRYSQFYSLHIDLKKLDNTIIVYDFPPKKSIGKKDSTLVEERRKRLQTYLRKIIIHWPELAECSNRYILEQQLPFFKDQPDTKEPNKKNIFSPRNRNSSTTDHDRSCL